MGESESEGPVFLPELEDICLTFILKAPSVAVRVLYGASMADAFGWNGGSLRGRSFLEEVAMCRKISCLEVV